MSARLMALKVRHLTRKSGTYADGADLYPRPWTSFDWTSIQAQRTLKEHRGWVPLVAQLVLITAQSMRGLTATSSTAHVPDRLDLNIKREKLLSGDAPC